MRWKPGQNVSSRPTVGASDQQLYGCEATPALGIILILATPSYPAMIVLAFMLPALEEQVHNYLVILPIAAEVWMLFYLLIIGVRTPRTAEHSPTPVAPLPA